MHLSKLAALLGASALLVASPSFAAPYAGSWPAHAHDYSRTSRADGVGAMKNPPTVAWTLQLGGALSTGQALVSDLAGTGQPDVLSISGGRVVATEPNGTTMWKAGLAGAQTLLGVWDLDGVAPSEVVVDTLSGVVVLRATDGMLMTTLSTTGPVNGTFVPQGPTGGILVLAASRGAVSGYDFRAGLGVTTALWSITGETQTQFAAADIDGDGTQDLVRPLDAGFEIDDPLTGNAKYSLAAMGPTAYAYNYEIANVDGRPGNEIIAIDFSYTYSPDAGIYVLGVNAGALTTLWSSAVTATATLATDFFTVAGSTADLDGDGTFEVVYSQWDGTAQAWTTRIVNAATGAALGTIGGQVVEAVGDIDGDGKQEIVVRTAMTDPPPARSTLGAYDFDSSQVGPVAKSWSLLTAHVMDASSRQHVGPWVDLAVPVVAAFVGGTFDSSAGVEVVVGQDTSNSGQDDQLSVLNGASGSVITSATITATVVPTIIDWGNGLTKSGSTNDVVTYGTDGVVHVRTGGLTDYETFPAGTYSNWMSALTTTTGLPNLFATTSNDHLQWIDGRQLHSNGQPYVRFDEPNVVDTSSDAVEGEPRDPVAVLNGKTSATLVTLEQGPTLTSIVGHDASGVQLWKTPLAAGSFVVEPGSLGTDLNGDGQDDLILVVENASTVVSVATFDGASGALMASAALNDIVAQGDGLGTPTLADVNGDGKLDLVTPVHGAGLAAVDLTANPFTQLWLVAPSGVLDGTMGVAPLVSASGPDGGPPASELFRVNGADGFGPYECLSLTGALLGSADQGLTPQQGFDENSVALVSRSQTGAFDPVSAGTSGAGLSRVRRLAGATISTMWTVYVSNGAVSASAPGAPSALHDPLELDVDGNGVEDIVMGSDDGYVYALSSADGSLVFSVNLDAPVKHLIAANIDQDPALELVASLADGRMVALDDNYMATQDPPDGGAEDSGADSAAPHDAGLPPSDDGSADGAAVGATGGGGGCGCRTAGDVGSEGALALAACLAGLVARRRVARRRSRRGTGC